MKTLTSIIIVAALSVTVNAMAASNIQNSRHNLSASNTSNSTFTGASTQICVYCHTPHNAIEKRALWNRKAPTSTFINYTSGVNKAKADWYAGGLASFAMEPGSPSLMCMSCHDGVTTMGNLHRPPVDASASTAKMSNVDSRMSNLGTDLTNDHPVSMIYQKAVDNATDLQGAATLRPIAMVSGKPFVQNGSVKLPLSTTSLGVTLECASCHNVHDDTVRPFLRINNNNSALCLVCHIK
jgi:predicted CXXCH cytochrome family protein